MRDVQLRAKALMCLRTSDVQIYVKICAFSRNISYCFICP